MNKYYLYLLCSIISIVEINSQTAMWSVPPTYDSLEEYGSLYKIRKDGKVGLADIAGKVLIEARYDSITPFYEHLALALEYSSGKYLLKGIIDDYNYGMVTPSGHYYVNMKYPMFYNGRLVVSDNTNKYGFLLQDGSIFIACQYDAVGPFYEGIAYTKKGKNVEYLQLDGRELNTTLENEGYIFLTGSHFNERGEAFVQAKQVGSGMRYSIINTSGIEVREAKISGKKLKNYEYRKPFNFNTISNSDWVQDPIKIVKDNSLYGFIAENGSILLPLQFTDASPFKNGYAKVKKNGKYGILKIESGSFSGKLDAENIVVRNGNCNPVTYSLSYPIAYNDIPMELYVGCGEGEKEKIRLNKIVDGEMNYSFVPILQNNEEAMIYHYSLYANNLLLWEDTQRMSISYIKSYPPVLKVPQVTEDFSIDEDGFVRADSSNKVDVYTVIENHSSEVLNITVMLEGDRVTGVNEDVSVPPGGKRRISTSINNIKERSSIEIYAKTSTGLEQKNIIKVKPFV